MERASSTKHALWEGEVFAMAGASLSHNLIVGNVTRLLGNLLVDGPCIVLPSGMKVFVPLTEGIVYPDVSVVCGAPELLDGQADVIVNPGAIVEVLSDSTERFDRGDKFAGYRSLPSVIDYVLIDQSRVRVEHYTRQGDGTWVLRAYEAVGELVLATVPGSISLADIYHKVPLPSDR